MAKNILIFFLKMLYVSAFLILYNFTTNGYLNNYDYNTLSNYSFHIFFIMLYIFIFRKHTNTKIDVGLFLASLLVTTITAYFSSWKVFFPEFFPFNLILCLIAIYIVFFVKKNKYYLILFFGIIAFISGKFYIANYYYKASTSNSEKIKRPLIKEMKVLNINLDTIVVKTENYAVTVINWGFIDCLPCNNLDEIFEENIIPKYQYNKNIFFGKFNISDSISRIDYFTKGAYRSHYYLDKDFKNYKLIKNKGYPITIVINNIGEIVYRYDGYNVSDKQNYINDLTKIIDSLTTKQYEISDNNN